MSRPSPDAPADTTPMLVIGTGYRPLLREIEFMLADAVSDRLPLALSRRPGNRESRLRWLAEARLDLLIDRAPERRLADRFDWRPLCHEPVGVFADVRHPLASEIHVAMHDLAAFPIRVADDDPILTAEIVRQLCTEGAVDSIDPKPLALRASKWRAAGAIDRTQLLAAPVGLLADALRRGDLIALPVSRPLAPLELGVLSRRRALPASTLDALVASLAAGLDANAGATTQRRDFLV